MGYAMFIGIGMIAMIIDLLLGTPQILIVLQHLIGRIVEIFHIARHFAHKRAEHHAGQCHLDDKIGKSPAAFIGYHTLF